MAALGLLFIKRTHNVNNLDAFKKFKTWASEGRCGTTREAQEDSKAGPSWELQLSVKAADGAYATFRGPATWRAG